MFKKRIVTVALALALASGMAQAVNVVDTGTPTGIADSFNKTQYFAGEFSFAGAAIIDSIQGYFSTAAGNVVISVFSDVGGLPDTALFSTSLATTAGASAWNGVSGLSWAVDADKNYWVVFAPDYAGNLSYLTAPIAREGAPSALSTYAIHHDDGVASWQQAALNPGFGVRIGATVSAVPEPSSLLMYGAGIIALGFIGRRKLA